MPQIQLLSSESHSVRKDFYVYEHTRQDTGEVFYVGKGRGRRANIKNKYHRNQFWQNAVAKAGGFGIRYVATGADEELAFLVEIERINQLRRIGVRLCNLTDGGDGTSGWVKSAEWRAKLSAAHKGKTVSPEVRAKISAAVKTSGYVPSLEIRQKMSDAHKGHHRNVGRVQSPEEIAKRSASLKGTKSRLGQTRSPEERAKSSAKLKGRVQTKQTCPHCGKVGGNIMKRYHFDSCKDAP